MHNTEGKKDCKKALHSGLVRDSDAVPHIHRIERIKERTAGGGSPHDGGYW